MQGDIITVISRVDGNWAEGKLGDKVGIFPVLFVEVGTALAWHCRALWCGEGGAEMGQLQSPAEPSQLRSGHKLCSCGAAAEWECGTNKNSSKQN